MTVGPLSVVRCAESDSLKPHNLMMGDELIACLTDHMATRIEAQLAGGTLRIVDVSGSGLPRWPDLTELREAVTTLIAAQAAHDDADMIEEETTGPALDDAEAALRIAAWSLCYPDSDT